MEGAEIMDKELLGEPILIPIDTGSHCYRTQHPTFATRFQSGRVKMGTFNVLTAQGDLRLDPFSEPPCTVTEPDINCRPCNPYSQRHNTLWVFTGMWLSNTRSLAGKGA